MRELDWNETHVSFAEGYPMTTKELEDILWNTVGLFDREGIAEVYVGTRMKDGKLDGVVMILGLPDTIKEQQDILVDGLSKNQRTKEGMVVRTKGVLPISERFKERFGLGQRRQVRVRPHRRRKR